MPYGVFDAADGPLVVTVGNNGQFQRFCRDVIGRADLADDPRYRSNLERSANRASLLPEIEREIAARPRKALLAQLERCGIPCGEVLGLHEALTSRRAVEGGLVTTQPHPQAGSVQVLAPPYRLDGERLPVRHAPPQLGGDTRQVLQGLLGLDDEALARLKSEGVV